MTAQLTAQRVQELLIYEPESGLFTRRISSNNAAKCQAGQPCGSSCGSGYLRMEIDYAHYRMHRLAWIYMTGQWPSGEIDHINGNRTDNRWTNLRDLPKWANTQNLRQPMSTSKTGVLGVSPQRGQFVAQISINGTTRFLGRFRTIGEAKTVYIAAKRQYHEGNLL